MGNHAYLVVMFVVLMTFLFSLPQLIQTVTVNIAFAECDELMKILVTKFCCEVSLKDLYVPLLLLDGQFSVCQMYFNVVNNEGTSILA
jgi:hypothetical protein